MGEPDGRRDRPVDPACPPVYADGNLPIPGHATPVGIPHRLVVGDKGIAQGTVEYKSRHEKATRDWPLDKTVAEMCAQLKTTSPAT